MAAGARTRGSRAGCTRGRIAYVRRSCPGGGGGFSGLFQDLFSDVFSSLFVDLFGVETSGGATEAYRETWYVRGIGVVKQEIKDGDGNVLQTRTLQSCTDLPHASCP